MSAIHLCGHSAAAYEWTVRLTGSLFGAVAALIWGLLLFEGIAAVTVLACADLPGFPITRELLFSVVTPTAMLTVALASIALVNCVPRSRRGVTLVPFAALALLLPYYGFMSGVSITQSALGDCL